MKEKSTVEIDRTLFVAVILQSVNALLLFSHGSVLCGSEKTLEDLTARLRAQNAAPIVEFGFLNYSEPLFAEAFARCVKQGATQITVVPYFLVAGKFVVVDLPREIDKQRELFPDVEVKVADAMCFHESLADAIVSCAARAQPPAAWRDILQLASERCRASEACPLFDTLRCPASNLKQ
jgi:sirohydrochlorin cobaltochelatase